MGILAWIIFGGIAGWLASILGGTDGQQGVILNIVVGIVGAVLGGALMNVFGKAGVTGFNFRSFVVAILGALLLLFIVSLF